MDSREHPWRNLGRQHLSTLPSDSKSGAEHRLRCCGTHCQDEVGLTDPKFRFQPWTTRCDFTRIRLLMNSAFPSRLPFEMFYGVGDINLRPIDSSFLERTVHDFASRTNKRLARDIFVVARLFADQHHRRTFGTVTEYGLGRSLVQMTCGAMICCFANRGQTR